MVDTFTGLITSLQAITASYPVIGGTYTNGQLIFDSYSGNTVRDEYGNYVPETKTEVIVKVRFYHDPKSQIQVDPNYNEKRTYLKGHLVEPSTYNGSFPDRVKCILTENNVDSVGFFQFTNYITDAIAENIDTMSVFGQKICGYFERENISL